MFSRLFEAHGLATRVAASAEEALRMLGDEEARPDLVLSDISMPGLDGAALIKALRAAPQTARIPAILMSGLALPKGLLEAASASLGVGPVFIKGGDLQGLVTRVMRLLRPRDEPQIVVDPLKRTVRIDGVLLPELPARRFQLLCALLREPRAMSREELLEGAWNGKDNLNVVDVTVLRLRQDLKDCPFLRIQTTPAGYRVLIGPYSL